MIAPLLIQFILLIIVPVPKETTTHHAPVHNADVLRHKAEELCELSKAHWYTDPKKAVAYGKEAIKIAETINDQLLIAKAYNNTGAGFFNLGDYNTSAEFYYESVRLREALADTAGLSASYNNIGNIYLSQKNYYKAKIYYNKALSLASQIQDTLVISRALNNLGNVYEREEKFEVALRFYHKSLPLKEKTNDIKGIVISLINIGNTYQKQGKYSNALHYLQRGLALSGKTKSLHDQTYAYRGLAETYLGLKDYRKAERYGKQSLDVAQHTYSKNEAKTSAEVLQKIYSETGDFEKAYQYLHLSAAYNDSINTEEITRQTTSFQVKYETAQKEKENLKLLAEHEKHEQEIEHKTIVQYATVLLLILSLTVVIVAYLGNRRMKRLNKLLSRKNKKVSQYSEDIKKKRNELAAQALMLQQQKEELENLNQLKDKLFSIVAHDLRGPLLSLKSLLQVLAMGKIPEEKFLHFAKTLEAEQQNTLWLVDNLLVWARSQMQGTSVKREQINIYSLTANTLDLLAPQAKSKGVQMHNLAQEDMPAYADVDMIQLVLRNLVSNAIKFCNEGDMITIETELTDHDMLLVTVRDTGVGINAEKLPKLFGLRSYTSLGTAKEKGSGFGLAMCRDFVDNNGGRIWVESTEGEGSTFKFTLPLATQTIAINTQLASAETI
ncbi:tetratricopeptide repeat-containing sensor histidine kinase [Pontibacter pudoricolor]|uniref:tetratricopeptide repeat-containing sensor histidine kinase n=1 Tax=Pontibacter pudoricolor TaxID=2694930 RepID=UPI0013918F29|nr:tetratricopeptide repeat-containing sensor histidine kinase [Pontibacter pudoricolor]